MTRALLIPAALAVLAAGGLAVAQTATPMTVAQAEREAAEAALRSRQFTAEAEKATGEAARARARSQALVADIQKIEADITAAEGRTEIAEAQRAAARARLAERQQPLVRLTAALQTMARRPPALALVQPGSVQDIVRVRALLASTLPQVRQRTAGLRAEVAATERLTAEAARNKAALAAGRDALRERRIELARLEENERSRSRDLASAAMGEEDRSIAFGEEARAAAGEMQSERHRARLGRELALLPSPALRPVRQASEAPGPAASYRLPVEGRLLTGTGELSDAGVHARGLTFQTAADAAVTAPRGGRIAYAGRFRDYGEIVIIDHGGGWTSTVTGLAALRVRQGEKVASGTALGRSNGRLTVELRRNGRPMPITPLLAGA